MSVPAQAVSTYERLREQVLSGESRPEGLSALVYHGMLRGLTVILNETPAEEASPTPLPPPQALPADRQFLRVMVNMVLQSQSRGTHAY